MGKKIENRDSVPTIVSDMEEYLTDKQAGAVEQLVNETTNKVVGAVMQVIEMLGLPEKQEHAFKSSVKEKIWEGYKHQVNLLYETFTGKMESGNRSHL